MPTRMLLIAVGVLVLAVRGFADDTLYRYEGGVLPYDASAGWQIFDACETLCSESLEDGYFVLTWTGSS